MQIVNAFKQDLISWIENAQKNIIETYMFTHLYELIHDCIFGDGPTLWETACANFIIPKPDIVISKFDLSHLDVIELDGCVYERNLSKPPDTAKGARPFHFLEIINKL